jgi:hypothetical protein
LRLEDFFPRVARHGFHPNWTTKDRHKNGGDLVRRQSLRSFEFNNAAAAPFCL